VKRGWRPTLDRHPAGNAIRQQPSVPPVPRTPWPGAAFDDAWGRVPAFDPVSTGPAALFGCRALARACPPVPGPFFLLDEPSSGLDAPTKTTRFRQSVLHSIVETERDRPILLVEHDNEPSSSNLQLHSTPVDYRALIFPGPQPRERSPSYTVPAALSRQLVPGETGGGGPDVRSLEKRSPRPGYGSPHPSCGT